MLDNWEHYFETRHEGLGTTYERFILHAYFRKLRDRYGLKTVLEAPVFGMTGISGINSIWWAMQGSQVTLVDHNRERIAFIQALWHDLSLRVRLVYDGGRYTALPFENQEFDMSWNFAALNSCHNPKGLLRELARVSRKIIFICVPNSLNVLNLSCAIRQKGRRFSQQRRTHSRIFQETLTQAGWYVKETGYLDVPPWPDIAMAWEDFLQKIGLKHYARRLKQEITPEKRICILDYYSGRNETIKKAIQKYAFLENSPRIFKGIWAHHRYLVFAPRNPL